MRAAFADSATGRLGRLDPRAKMGWFAIALASVVVAREPMAVASLALITLAVVWWGGVLRHVGGAMVAIAPFLVLVTIFDVAYHGVVGGIVAGVKLLLAVIAFATLMRSTTSEDLAAGLVRVGCPFETAFTLTAGARFVPVVAREASEIFDALRARGVAYEESLIARGRMYARVLIPLVVATVSRSVRLAEAMEARGFGISRRRTSLREYRLGRSDWLLLAVGLAGGIISLVIQAAF